MVQLKLFDATKIREIRLEANSKKQAFWILKICTQDGRWWLEKESGGNGRVLDRRIWPMGTRDRALHQFNCKVRQKLNPRRLSARIYKEVG